MRQAAGLLLTLALAGCSVSANVIGRVGPDGSLYRGVATGYMDRTGTIEMTSDSGSRCVGEFRYTGSHTGMARLHCNDGRTADVQFNALGTASGYGYGTASDGSPVAFTYGLSQEDGARYLAAAPKAAQRRLNPPAPRATRASSGTGFFVTADGHVLTNAHVVSGCNTIRVRGLDGARSEAQLVAADARNDLAVIRLRDPAPSFARFARSAYRQGDQVVAYGFPLSGTLSSSGNLTTGTVTALAGLGNDSRYVQISAPIQPGNSGGPVADMTGAIIGVVTSKLDPLRLAKATGDLPQNVNFAIKDVVAKAFLQAHGIGFSEAHPASAQSVADVGDMLRRTIVQIECENR